MMHHHNMHQPVSGHPGQHMNHHGMPTHHQMAPHTPHQMHREQNRMLPGPGQQGGGGMAMGMNINMSNPMGHCPPPPRPLLAPRLQHHHRPPPPTPRHLPPPLPLRQPHPQHSMIPSHPPHPPRPPHPPHPPIQQPVPSVVLQTGVLTTVGKKVPELEVLPPLGTESITTSSLPKILPDISSSSMANSKEKTPMCLVNELARFNKIQHQYRLTSEQGPAHRKRFTVALRLGGDAASEEYSAEGSRIRTAQHAVAAEALARTRYPRPPPRPPRAVRAARPNASGSIMPTVELNALTMKLGVTAVYTVDNPATAYPEHAHMRNASSYAVAYRPGMPPSAPSMVPLQTFNRNSRYFNQNNRFGNNYTKYPNNPYKEQTNNQGLYQVKLVVGTRQYHGEGATPQAARHDAAASALRDLRQNQDDDVCNENDSQTADDGDSDDKDSLDLKSPVSMVHEVALKFNLPVNFDVKSEKGPPHMKTFITICTVAMHVTEGEGSSKKISKKRAAEKMLEELKKLPSIKKTVTQPEKNKPKRKQQQPKKRTRNLIKDKADPTASTEANPVSRLLQWAVGAAGAGGGREPTYSLLEEGRGTWRRTFLVQCLLGARHTTGSGASKKLAKRQAAEKMLIDLGLGKTQTPSKSSEDSEKSVELESPRKGPYLSEASKLGLDTPAPGAAGRQLVPGLLLMQDHLVNANPQLNTPNKNGVNAKTTAAIAKELLNAGTSPTADALAKQDHNHRDNGPATKPISSSVVSSTTGTGIGTSSQTNQAIRPKEQLLYLARLLGFQVQFSLFPKGNHQEYLSLLTLTTDPPMVCHGGGQTTEQSHDQSARAALEYLSKMGLDNVTPQNGANPRQGDGIHGIPGSGGSIPGILTNGITK